MNEIQEKIAQGYLHTRAIIELVGKPKEHVEQTIKDYTAKIKESTNIEILNESYADCIEEDGFYSTFVELEMLVKGLSTFIGFCFDYMPSSIEIMAPEKMVFSSTLVSAFLNDLQAKLHTMDMITKRNVSEANFFKRNFNALIKNTLSIILYQKHLTLEEISTISGIPKDELETTLDTLRSEGKIKKEGDHFSLNDRAQ